jgi:2-oxoglutarate ferredoxin oxidoreductase subunit gamma
MLFQVIMAGFGGQGIMYMGDLLAGAGLGEGRRAAFFPSYGVAMRGGTANCVVTLSDQDIGSPLPHQPNAAILMNSPSFKQFHPTVRTGGVIVANASMIDRDAFTVSDGVRVVWVPAAEISRTAAGNERSANVVMLGAFLRAEPIVQTATIEKLLGKSKTTGATNLAVFRAGLEYEGA